LNTPLTKLTRATALISSKAKYRFKVVCART
jgi:hypothetical protein